MFEFLRAENDRLYVKGERERRVGQMIIQHTEESSPPRFVYDVPLDRDILTEKLLIGYDDFVRILASGKYWPLLNLPLYSKAYYTGIPFENVKKKPIPFDFIQIQGRALIFANGDEVQLIGQIDDLASYLLVKHGLVLSTEILINAIRYATENNLPIPNVKHPLVQAYIKLRERDENIKFESVTKEGNIYTVRTNIGYIYFDGKRLSNTMQGFKLVKKLPITEGFLEREPYRWVLRSFTLKDDAVVDFEIDEEGRVLPFLEVGGEKVYLDAKISLRDGQIISNEKQKVKFAKEYTHHGVHNFIVEEDGIKVISVIEIDNQKVRVLEDAEAFEMTDTLEFEDGAKILFGEVASRSPLLSTFNFLTDELKVAFFTLGKNSFILTYGSGKSSLKGVLDKRKQHFLINDGLNVRVYRVIRLDKFEGTMKIVGKPEGVEELTRLLELNFVSKVFPLAVKVELGVDDVFITLKSKVGEMTVQYSREVFKSLKAFMKNGTVRFGYDFIPLPIDDDGFRVYSVAFEQREEVLWLVGRPDDVPVQTLRRKYVYWNGVFNYLKRKIRPVGIPKELRPSKELCIKDLYGRITCIPISAQRTLF